MFSFLFRIPLVNLYRLLFVSCVSSFSYAALFRHCIYDYSGLHQLSHLAKRPNAIPRSNPGSAAGQAHGR